MNLLFVEGVSGVGKTTMTETLCSKLQEAGFAVNRYLEFDLNPVDFYCTAYIKHDEYTNLLSEYPEFAADITSNTVYSSDIKLVRYCAGKTALFPAPMLDILREHEFCYYPERLVPLSEYTRVYRSVWERFAGETERTLDYLLFDGSLFHHPINDMTRNYGASFEQCSEHINSLLDAVRVFNPYIIYLSAKDVKERLTKAHMSRSEAAPTKEQIRFWEERKQVDFAVMERLNFPHKVYDISEENWGFVLNEIMNVIIAL